MGLRSSSRGVPPPARGLPRCGRRFCRHRGQIHRRAPQINRDDPNGGGNHREHPVQALGARLKRLGTDYIDLYWLHARNFLTPIEDVMRSLDDQVRAGKFLYVGVSDTHG